ncbi:hypothetical protein D3C76_716830 [compost metagenome]
MHALLTGARNTQRPRTGILQRLIARGIVNFKLIAVAAAENKLRAVASQQRVEGGDIRPYGTRGYRQPLRQFILRQRLVLQQIKQLR